MMSAVAHFRESLAIIVFAVELDRFELEQECGESVRCHLWFRCHEPDHVRRPRPIAEISRELQARCIADPKIVEQKETAPDQQICRCEVWPAKEWDGKNREDDRTKPPLRCRDWKKTCNANSQRRHQGQPEKRLPRYIHRDERTRRLGNTASDSRSFEFKPTTV